MNANKVITLIALVVAIVLLVLYILAALSFDKTLIFLLADYILWHLVEALL